LYAPLDLLGILGAPNEGYDSNLFDSIGLFYGYHESTLSHIVSFIKVMIESHIVHEDVWMRTFLCTFEDKAMDWFYDLGNAPIEPIITFAYFLRIFLKRWDPYYEEEEYGEFIECFMALLPKKEEAHFHVPLEEKEPIHDSIKDQEHEEDFCD
jgi:hypothetical protein